MLPKDVKSLHLKDFLLIHNGYEKRQQREVNQTRNIMAYIRMFGGMGSSELVFPKDVWPLPMDKENEKKMITTMKQALAMLKEFQDCLKK